MMLSDLDLTELATKTDIVTPFNPENCEGATIDLTLHVQIKVHTSIEPIVLGEKIDELRYNVIDIEKERFYLEPGMSVLVQSNEYFKIPINMAAIILERHSVKLLGLTIIPASYMNPGYEGRMSFLATNHTSVPIRIIPGVKFC